MRRWRKVVLVSVFGVVALGAAPATASGQDAPTVLVTGDSLSDQATTRIRDALAARGYERVRFAVHGGTTIDWAADRVREGDEDIVVVATGTMHVLGGWTTEDARSAEAAVALLSTRPCALWVVPPADGYPGGRPAGAVDWARNVAGIRGAIAGSPVRVVAWDEVAAALPEIHIWDGIHQTEEGQRLYADTIAGSVAAGCAPADPALTAWHARYVDLVHRVLLGRPATAEESGRWSALLDGGHPRIAFTRRLSSTPEWITGQIAELYRRALGREPDPAGLEHWRRAVASGSPLSSVAAHVYGSAEALRRAGGTHAGLVTALYRGLLHREPDPDGLRHWTGRMAAGLPAPTVAAAFHDSTESRRDRVARLYRTILGREPDAGGLRSWADALLHTGDVRLAAALAASEELLARARA